MNVSYLYVSFLVSFVLSGLAAFKRDVCKFTRHLQQKNVVLAYKSALPLVCFNTFLTVPGCIYVIRPFIPEDKEFNVLQIFMLPVYALLIDVFFFTAHYAFHSKYLYPLHKIHHRFKQPVSICALYAHPLEILFGNILPLFGPLMLFPTSAPLVYLWIVFTTYETTFGAHSGVVDWGDDHDLHHRLFNVNYGTGLYLCDRIFGTYIHFKSKPVTQRP
jgi:sterol desaturase/sphingolipid hydroxylase (fatty acid hydroxylase superfamily)